MIASARRVLASRAALAAGSLLVGGGVGAAFSARASAAEKSAMDRVRERAGMPDGTDPWGKPLESVTSQRLANIDVHALGESHAPRCCRRRCFDWRWRRWNWHCLPATAAADACLQPAPHVPTTHTLMLTSSPPNRPSAAAGRMELVAENLKVPAGGSAEEQLVAQQKMTNILLQTIAVR